MLPLAEALRACAESRARLRPLRQSRQRRPVRRLPRPASATPSSLCVVAEVEDLWAMERAAHLPRPLPRAGRHLCGRWTASAPRSWASSGCCAGSRGEGVAEVILALGATVDGQTTEPLSRRAAEPAGLRGHPARPRRADRRRADLSRRGHAGRRPARPPAGRLTAIPAKSLPRASFLSRLRSHGSHGAACHPRGPAPAAEAARGTGRAGRRQAAPSCSPTCWRRCTRPRHRPRRTPGRACSSASSWSTSPEDERAPADGRRQPRDLSALGRAVDRRGGLPQPARASSPR